MSKYLFVVTALMLFVDAKAQSLSIEPSSPNDVSDISITLGYTCYLSTQSMNHSINGFVIEFDIELDEIINHPPCLADPPPPHVYTYHIGQLPAGDYQLYFNTTHVYDNSFTQQSVFITVGAAPAPVPLNTSFLAFFVLGLGLIWFKKHN